MEPECGEDFFLFFFSLHLNLRGKIPKLRTKICTLHLNLGPKFRNSRLKENQVAAPKNQLQKDLFWSSHGLLFRAHQANSERERCLQQIQ